VCVFRRCIFHCRCADQSAHVCWCMNICMCMCRDCQGFLCVCVSEFVCAHVGVRKKEWRIAHVYVGTHVQCSRDTSTFVTSCPIGMSLPANSSCEGRVPLHFTQSGLSIPTTAGVVVERGSEDILTHTGPREWDGYPLGGCGSGFGLVPSYTTLSVRVRTNI